MAITNKNSSLFSCAKLTFKHELEFQIRKYFDSKGKRPFYKKA
jgi:hypothetical protein